MALKQAHCANHPGRLAIGVCVETGKPVCGECSTRYNGVNYSREGLEIMLARRRREEAAAGGVGWLHVVALGVPATAALFLVYLRLGEWLTAWLRP